MAEYLKTIKAKVQEQVKLLEIAENDNTRPAKRKRKYVLEKHLKYVRTRLEIQDLQHEKQEIMVAGDNKMNW